MKYLRKMNHSFVKPVVNNRRKVMLTENEIIANTWERIANIGIKHVLVKHPPSVNLWANTQTSSQVSSTIRAALSSNVSARTNYYRSDDEESNEDSDSDSDIGENAALTREQLYINAKAKVDREILLYKRIVKSQNTLASNGINYNTVPINNPLSFWLKNQTRFPVLAQVARIVYAWTPSAAAVEVDFGLSGLIVPGRRCRTSDGMVDIRCTLYANKKYKRSFNLITERSDEEVKAKYQKIYHGYELTNALWAGVDGN